MPDNPNLEDFEEGGSVTAQKIRELADEADAPKVDDGILSPHRDEILGS